jgi:hypothetical protein
MRRQLSVVLALLLGGLPALAQFGDLAAGSTMRWRLAGAEAEMGITFAMDPAFLSRCLPRGFRAITVGAAAAQGDSAARSVLATHPDFASHVVAMLAISRLDSTVVEGGTAPSRPDAIAVWWVPVQAIDSAAPLPDGRARIGGQLVELGFWNTNPGLSRRLSALMPTAATAPLTVARDAGGAWQVRLVIPGGTIAGSCHPIGAPRPAGYSLPQFSTVWAADTVTRAFVVYTYYGHRTQPCTGEWHATGGAALARALRTSAILSVEDQSGWRARAAVYAPR